MNEALNQLIQKTVQEFSEKKGFELPKPFECELARSKDPAHGDFASNVAFKLARFAKEKPTLIADELVLLIESARDKQAVSSVIERVEAAGGGFLNFYLAKNSLGKILKQVRSLDSRYGHSDFGKGQKVLLEFVSANPTGPLTIAHGRQAAVGDCLARILKASGHHLETEYYLNDAGRQMNLLGASLWARYKQVLGFEAPLPEDGYQGEYLLEIARRLEKSKKDSLLKEPPEAAINFCRKFAGDEIMAGIREDLKSVSVHFDHYFNESSLYEKKAVDQTLNLLTDRGFIYEKEGALWFRSTEFGDDKDRVVKKSTGEYTYLAPDMAYHKQKFDRGFSRLVNFWGPDHHGYIPRLKAAWQALGHNPGQIQICIVQLTTLFRKGEPVRMSTRVGEFVTMRELVQEVGPDATRFFFIMRKIESPLDFDLDLAKSKSQDNPVFYLQYAHARIASLIRFADRPLPSEPLLERLDSREETELITLISEFPKSVVQASEALEPYRLADYLRELATAFHKFYSNRRVVTDDADLTGARLYLCEAVRIVLRNGLELLGIFHPDSM